jgi:GAF domain-containing protein
LAGRDCSSNEAGKVIHVGDPAHAAAALRRSAADVRQVAVPHAGVAFPIALNESQRLVALERLGLLDTPPEEAFDRLTWLAAETLEAPISLITMLTPTRQWFKSRLGLDLPETPRSWAFCNHTILQKGVFSVEDLAADARFAANPAVAGEGGFRFYAGAPILDSDGFAVGSLCVIDYKRRTLQEREAQRLAALAALGSAEVRLRAAEHQLREVLGRAEQERVGKGGRSAAEHKTVARSRIQPRDAATGLAAVGRNSGG